MLLAKEDFQPLESVLGRAGSSQGSEDAPPAGRVPQITVRGRRQAGTSEARVGGLLVTRIDREHRLVYRVEGDRLIVLACRFHY